MEVQSCNVMFYKEHYFKVDYICINSVYLKKKNTHTPLLLQQPLKKLREAYSQLANKKCQLNQKKTVNKRKTEQMRQVENNQKIDLHSPNYYTKANWSE